MVSWELDQQLEMGFDLEAMEKALVRAKPAIWNSDQGSHFTSPQYIQRLLDLGIEISMDGKGRAIDSVFTERLRRTIKYEEVYLNEYSSPREARQGLKSYLEFYNDKRPHQALKYRTAAQLYLGEVGVHGAGGVARPAICSGAPGALVDQAIALRIGTCQHRFQEEGESNLEIAPFVS